MLPRLLLGIALVGTLCTRAWAIKTFAQLEDAYPEGKGVLELENTLTIGYHTPARSAGGLSRNPEA